MDVKTDGGSPASSLIITAGAVCVAAAALIFGQAPVREARPATQGCIKTPVAAGISDCFPDPISIVIAKFAAEAGLGGSEEARSRIIETICAESRRSGLDPLLVLAIIEEESRFSQDAVSPKGARGLMQIMPGTGEHVAAKHGSVPGPVDLFDPVTNITLGVRYFASLVRQFKDLRAALAAYCSGPTKTADYIMTTGEIPAEEDGYAARVLRRHGRLKLKAGVWGAGKAKVRRMLEK